MRSVALSVAALGLSLGCSDSGTSSGSNGGSSGGATPAAGDRITAATIAACPNSDTLVASSIWTSCLEGKRAVGTDPIDKSKACEVRFLAGNRVEFVYGGTTYASASPNTWKDGLYQNTPAGPYRQMLGSLNASALVKGEINEIDVSIVTEIQDDTIEITYFDEASARRTLTCKLDPL